MGYFQTRGLPRTRGGDLVLIPYQWDISKQVQYAVEDDGTIVF